ncbi:hypothetical protein ACFONC_03125 [Luteimonas soli]|uniref:Uncharacterized protein n=1 Tax=Luteimonas soli TaxID=1648966 RepID=A0ABV7XG58_9GAMM
MNPSLKQAPKDPKSHPSLLDALGSYKTAWMVAGAMVLYAASPSDQAIHPLRQAAQIGMPLLLVLATINTVLLVAQTKRFFPVLILCESLFLLSAAAVFGPGTSAPAILAAMLCVVAWRQIDMAVERRSRIEL